MPKAEQSSVKWKSGNKTIFIMKSLSLSRLFRGKAKIKALLYLIYYYLTRITWCDASVASKY